MHYGDKHPRICWFTVALALALVALLAWATPARCQPKQPVPLPATACEAQLPYGVPQPALYLICRAGYALDYNPQARVPVWDAHVLTPAHTIGCTPRSNAFAADQSVPADERATPKDYLHSGYDIGHMSPDADFTYSAALERQTFYLTNMAPQLPGLNRQTWKYLEQDIRAWAYGRKHPIWIITGPIWNGTPKTIGTDKVAVPSAFYKIVVDTTTGEALAFTMPQRTGLGKNISKFIVPLATVEAAAKVQLPGLNKLHFGTTLWPVSTAAYTKAKKAECAKH